MTCNAAGCINSFGLREIADNGLAFDRAVFLCARAVCGRIRTRGLLAVWGLGVPQFATQADRGRVERGFEGLSLIERADLGRVVRPPLPLPLLAAEEEEEEVGGLELVLSVSGLFGAEEGREGVKKLRDSDLKCTGWWNEGLWGRARTLTPPVAILLPSTHFVEADDPVVVTPYLLINVFFLCLADAGLGGPRRFLRLPLCHTQFYKHSCIRIFTG
jgi:hypothetical protein